MDFHHDDWIEKEIKNMFQKEVLNTSDLSIPQFSFSKKWTITDFFIGIGNIAAMLLLVFYISSSNYKPVLAEDMANKFSKTEIELIADKIDNKILILNQSTKIINYFGGKNEN